MNAVSCVQTMMSWVTFIYESYDVCDYTGSIRNVVGWIHWLLFVAVLLPLALDVSSIWWIDHRQFLYVPAGKGASFSKRISKSNIVPYFSVYILRYLALSQFRII